MGIEFFQKAVKLISGKKVSKASKEYRFYEYIGRDFEFFLEKN
jgi:hypothetical protein